MTTTTTEKIERPKPKALTDAERSRQWQDKRKREGWRHVQFWAGPELAAAIEKIGGGKGKDREAIEPLILKAARKS